MKSQVLLATDRHRWETISMSDTHKVIVGDKGRIVIPASVREQFNWQTGDELRIVMTETGIELMTPDAILQSLVGALKSDTSLTDQLIAERRAESAREDTGNS
jgi:AbrB family looped-hinge helix DNA binding protein